MFLSFYNFQLSKWIRFCLRINSVTLFPPSFYNLHYLTGRNNRVRDRERLTMQKHLCNWVCTLCWTISQKAFTSLDYYVQQIQTANDFGCLICQCKFWVQFKKSLYKFLQTFTHSLMFLFLAKWKRKQLLEKFHIYSLASPSQPNLESLTLIKEFIQLTKEFNTNSSVLTGFRSFIKAAENYKIKSRT